jgi:hypothetical protein
MRQSTIISRVRVKKKRIKEKKLFGPVRLTHLLGRGKRVGSTPSIIRFYYCGGVLEEPRHLIVKSSVSGSPLQEVGAHLAPQDASGGPCCRRVLARHREERQGGGSGGR